jgi:hypothetical protein
MGALGLVLGPQRPLEGADKGSILTSAMGWGEHSSPLNASVLASARSRGRGSRSSEAESLPLTGALVAQRIEQLPPK